MKYFEIKEEDGVGTLENLRKTFNGSMENDILTISTPDLSFHSEYIPLNKGVEAIYHHLDFHTDCEINVTGDNKNRINFQFEYEKGNIHTSKKEIQNIMMYDASLNYKIKGNKGDYLKILYVRFEKEEVRRYYKQLDFTFKDLYSKELSWLQYDIISLEIQLLLKDIFELNREENAVYNRFIFAARTYEVIGIILKNWTDRNTLNSISIHKDDLDRLLEIKNILLEINTHLPPLSFFVEKYGYSESKFTRDFSKVFGTTITKFHNNFRLEQAKKMLQETRVKEVAFHFGYESVAAFSYAFKKKFGITPKEASSISK